MKSFFMEIFELDFIQICGFGFAVSNCHKAAQEGYL